MGKQKRNVQKPSYSKVLFPKRSIKMVDGSEKRNRQLAFELQNSHVCEKRSKAAADFVIDQIITIH